MKKLLFATQNKNKLKEAIEILRDKYDVSSPPALENEEELPEDFFTLPENACQKASFVAEKFNLNCFAEDTGLEVYALDLQPGVFSGYNLTLGEMEDIQKNKISHRKQALSKLVKYLSDSFEN